MRMLNAFTMEVDDPAVAVDELLEQLDLDHQLLKNSVGLVTCSADFVESGVVKAICEAMPFEVAGGTTIANAVNHEAGTMSLCLSVLTADDAGFATAISPPLSGDAAELPGLIQAAYKEAAAKLPEKPKLIFAFLPMLTTASGEMMLDPITEISGGAPIFGTIFCALDSAGQYTSASVINNGDCSRYAMSMVLLSGNIKPRFVLASISEKNMHRQQAVITSSEGSILKKINGMSAVDYLTSIGLLNWADGIASTSTMPLMVNYNDGSQSLARVIYSMNDNGSISCGGLMPEGAALAFCHLDLPDVLVTAEQSVEKILEDNDLSGVFVFSCQGRNMALGLTPMIEIETVKKAMGDKVPWHMSYSGGEACPVYSAEGRPVNRFHNFTFAACAL